MIYVLMYLAAIVAANLIVARLGPSASVVTAFAFIGLDLTARDRLHDAWRKRNLARNMALLIGAGSTLTVVVNWGAWRIAAASFAAFACASVADSLVYQFLYVRGWQRWARVNGSNVPSAFVDSMTFPVLAFGFPPLWGVMAGQFAAKVGGGFLWSLVLRVIERIGTGMWPTLTKGDG